MISNNQNFALLKLQRFCKMQDVALGSCFGAILQDFSFYHFEKKMPQQSPMPQSNIQKKEKNTISQDQFLHFLYLNNSYLLMSETEIMALFQVGTNQFSKGSMIDIDEFQKWINHQAKEHSLIKHQSNLDVHLVDQIKTNSIPIQKVQLIKEESYQVHEQETKIEIDFLNKLQAAPR